MTLSTLFQSFSAALERGQLSKPVFTQVNPGAAAYFLALATHKRERPWLVLTEGYEEARELYEDLCFYLPAESVGFFPHWDTLPYDNQSPAKEVIAQRLECLLGMLGQNIRVVVSTPQAATQKLLPASALLENSLVLKKGHSYDRTQLVQSLFQMGYQRVDQVEDRGEYAVRGEIIDIFPIQEATPVRLDFFDVELEWIKRFAVESQISGEELPQVRLLPAQEVIFNEETKKRSTRLLAELREGADKNEFFQVKEALEAQEPFSGMESYLPLFYEATASLFDYFPSPAQVAILEEEAFWDKLSLFEESINTEYEYSRHEGYPTPPPLRLFEDKVDFKRRLEAQGYWRLEPQDLSAPGALALRGLSNQATSLLALTPADASKSPVRRILEQILAWNQAGAKIAIAAGSHARAEHLAQLFNELGATPLTLPQASFQDHLAYLNSPGQITQASLVIFPSQLNRGFRFVDELGQTQVGLFAEEEIFGPKEKKRRVRKVSLRDVFSSLGDLVVGDYVVHVEYGVGKYEGLKKINAGAGEEDFLVIGYQGGDRVYVPVDKFHLVQKFTGQEGSAPRMAKLGDGAWAKTKAKVRSEVDEMAGELLKIYAKRAAAMGISFPPDQAMTHEFEMTFPYQETEDQLKAIEEVKADMESERPMDRLICGDVGFGKTEVAMRAAFKAVAGGFQVGVLAPTTILAQQHYENFVARYKNFPIRIGLVSRFQTPAQLKETLADLKEGKVDILVGTHRLLSQDVHFKKLGLLVVDEEQRFGVRHKESIKKLRASVDCLTLSATPIPRTLHMSLVGIRDISVINTPPMDRRAIRTRLMKLSDYVIQEAAEREIRRGGQIFFIHNRVESIQEVANYLTSILPRTKIAIAHGQMSEKDLDEVMHGFINKEYDILLATTIVESGLDIPNANTIIINNADQFGLSQLYQLRGRVGRSKAQAYCYLLTPKEKLLTEIAKKRLTILAELNHLGAGFKLASYDLELRGAGDVLGSKQSGHIAQVGFELYNQMIQEAVEDLRGEEAKERQRDRDLKIDLGLSATLPEQYIPSMNQRLDAYKSLASLKTEEELWEFRKELEDRFGKLPPDANALFDTMQVKILARSLNLAGLKRKGAQLELAFYPEFQPDPEKLFGFLKNQSGAKLLPPSGMSLPLVESQPTGVLLKLKEFQAAFA